MTRDRTSNKAAGWKLVETNGFLSCPPKGKRRSAQIWWSTSVSFFRVKGFESYRFHAAVALHHCFRSLSTCEVSPPVRLRVGRPTESLSFHWKRPFEIWRHSTARAWTVVRLVRYFWKQAAGGIQWKSGARVSLELFVVVLLVNGVRHLSQLQMRSAWLTTQQIQARLQLFVPH